MLYKNTILCVLFPKRLRPETQRLHARQSDSVPGRAAGGLPAARGQHQRTKALDTPDAVRAADWALYRKHFRTRCRIISLPAEVTSHGGRSCGVTGGLNPPQSVRLVLHCMMG